MKIIERISESRIIKSFHLHRSKPQDWIDAVYWLISTIFSGLMPIWLPILLLTLFSLHPPLMTFTKNGEFALISASLLSASIYVVTKESKLNIFRGLLGDSKKIDRSNLTFPHQRLFLYTANIITIVATVIYTGALISKLQIVNLTLDIGLVSTLSLILFCLTLGISFLITVVDNAFTNRLDIFEQREETLKVLETSFNSIKEDN